MRTLVTAGVISAADELRRQALRNLRNDRSHLKGHMLVDPGQAVNFLGTTAELINTLFQAHATDPRYLEILINQNSQPRKAHGCRK